MARLPRLYAPRIPQLVQARFARPLAQPDEPVPDATLDRISEWLAEEIERTIAPSSSSDAPPAAAHATAPATVAATPPVAAVTSPIALHAWAILPEAITLVATPATAQALPLLMQALGRRLGSGLLRARVYAGRYHNALLEPGRWVLPAMRWVETLAVAGGHVGQAAQWPWSSAVVHVGAGTAHPTLTDHPDYWKTGDTPFARQAAWRPLLAEGLDAVRRAQIEAALYGQWALGEKIFLAHLERLASRRVKPAPRGRPRKDSQPRR